MALSSRSSVLSSVLAIAAAGAFAFVATRQRPAPPTSMFVVNDFLGRPAPDFTLTDLNGNLVNLSSLRGRVVVLDFWATWCPPCVVELPINTAVAKKYADRGVVFRAINGGEPAERVKAFLAKQGLDTPVLLDPKFAAAAAYSAQYLPLLVVIDAEGRIVAYDSVEPDVLEATLSTWIESALKSGQAATRGSERPATRP